MPLTLTQRYTPFRAIGSRSAPYRNVLERSLYEGSAEEWAHWQREGVLTRALGRDEHRAGTLHALTQACAAGRAPFERLEQALEWAGEDAWGNRLEWLTPLLDSQQPDAPEMLAGLSRRYPNLPCRHIQFQHDRTQASIWEHAVLRACRARPGQHVGWSRLAENWLQGPLPFDASAWLATATYAFLNTQSGNTHGLTADLHAAMERSVDRLLQAGARADRISMASPVDGSAWDVWWRHHTWGQKKLPSDEAVDLGQRLLRSGEGGGLRFSPQTICTVLRDSHAAVMAPVLEDFRRALQNPWAEESVRGLGTSTRYSLDEGLWRQDLSPTADFAADMAQAERGLAWLEYLAQRADAPKDTWLYKAVTAWSNHMENWAFCCGRTLTQEEKDLWTRVHARSILAWSALLARVDTLSPLPNPLDSMHSMRAPFIRKDWNEKVAWEVWEGHEAALLRLLSIAARDSSFSSFEWLRKSLKNPALEKQFMPLAPQWIGWWWEAALDDGEISPPLQRLLATFPPEEVNLPHRKTNALNGAMRTAWQSFALSRFESWPEENLWVQALPSAESLSWDPEDVWDRAWPTVVTLATLGYPFQPPLGPSLLEQCMALPFFPIGCAQDLSAWGVDFTETPGEMVSDQGSPGHHWVFSKRSSLSLQKDVVPSRLDRPRRRM